MPALVLLVLALPWVPPRAWRPPAARRPGGPWGCAPASLPGLAGWAAALPLGPCCSLRGTGADTRDFPRKGDDVPTKGGDLLQVVDLKEGFLLFSAEEREVLLDALSAGQRDLVTALVLARRRTVQRAESDAQTDARRRILVGARVSRKRAERFRKCAQDHKMSLYRFVDNALEREYRYLTLTE